MHQEVHYVAVILLIWLCIRGWYMVQISLCPLHPGSTLGPSGPCHTHQSRRRSPRLHRRARRAEKAANKARMPLLRQATRAAAPRSTHCSLSTRGAPGLIRPVARQTGGKVKGVKARRRRALAQRVPHRRCMRRPRPPACQPRSPSHRAVYTPAVRVSVVRAVALAPRCLASRAGPARRRPGRDR